jgi:hypothetical protein
MTGRGKPKYSKKNLFQNHTFHHTHGFPWDWTHTSTTAQFLLQRNSQTHQQLQLLRELQTEVSQHSTPPAPTHCLLGQLYYWGWKTLVGSPIIHRSKSNLWFFGLRFGYHANNLTSKNNITVDAGSEMKMRMS